MKTDSTEMTAKRFLDLITGRIPPRKIRPEELKTLRDLTADAKVKELGVTDKFGTLIKQVQNIATLKPSLKWARMKKRTQFALKPKRKNATARVFTYNVNL